MTPAKMPRIQLRTILMAVNIMVFLLPLVGIMFFRVYENTLVQQTETELISQAAVVAAAYKQELFKHIDDPQNYGNAADPESLSRVDEYYTPIIPSLDLSKTGILPPRGDGQEGAIPDETAAKAGETLSPLIIESQKTTLSGIKIMDFKGISVAGRTELNIDFSFLPEIQHALSGYYTSVIRERVSDHPAPALASISRGTGIRVFVAFPVMHENRVWGVVYLSRTPQNILKHMYTEKWKVVFVICALLSFTVIIAILTSYLISRPINQLIKRTKQFAEGDMDALETPNTATVHEIALLSDSFANMARALNTRSEYIRNFAMHVSHEFKTPITAIQGSAELLLDHESDMDSKKRRKFLSNIISDSDRLKRLVSRLLELARADNITVTDEVCDLQEITGKIQDRYSAMSGFDITIGQPPPTRIRMSQDNLEAILVNLCDNAHQNGASKLTIETLVRGNMLVMSFTDNGKGISEANAAKIFTPFFTTRRNAGGTGIGLGIVYSILESHGGTITLVDTKEKGACFRVFLKTQ